MKRRSSLRTTLAPMPSTPMSCPPSEMLMSRRFACRVRRSRCDGCRPQLFRRLRDLHAGGGVEHRFDDIVIAGAAADIAFQLVPDGLLVELAAMAMDDVDRRHDHARSTVTALQAVIVAESRLHRVQFVTFRDALDGGDAGACGLSCYDRAG